MQRSYSFTATIWKWPGHSGWHFVTLPTELFTEIRSIYGKGMVPVRASGHGYEWRATLFPYLKTSNYLLALSKKARMNTQCYEGDTIKLDIAVDA